MGEEGEQEGGSFNSYAYFAIEECGEIGRVGGACIHPWDIFVIVQMPLVTPSPKADYLEYNKAQFGAIHLF